MSVLDSRKIELPLALAATAGGIGITSWAAFTHMASWIAPGATLIFLGSAWLGNVLARYDVRILRTPKDSATANRKNG